MSSEPSWPKPMNQPFSESQNFIHLRFISNSLQIKKKNLLTYDSPVFNFSLKSYLPHLICCCACLRLCHCSSQESAKAKTQKEVIKTLKELKLHLPTEKRHNNKSTTLNTLKYALRCVKQVEGKVVHLFFSCVSCPFYWSIYCYYDYVLQPMRNITSYWWSMTVNRLAWMFPLIQSKR